MRMHPRVPFLACAALVLLVALAKTSAQATCTSPADCEDGNPCTEDLCDPVSGCSHLPLDCSDGNSCTDDSCDPATGACVHTDSGSCTENPKSLGYWQRVCRGTGNVQDAVTQSDVSWMAAHSCTLGPPQNTNVSVELICRILTNTYRYGCSDAAQEFLALSLNLSRGRVSFTDRIDSHCTDHTTVAQSYTDADHHLCNDQLVLGGTSLSGGGPGTPNPYCELHECECREINQGRALHVHGLIVSRLANGDLHLAWIPPLGDADDFSATPGRYRIWRATTSGGPFVQIAEVADTSFDDTAAVGERLVYDVTPVW